MTPITKRTFRSHEWLDGLALGLFIAAVGICFFFWMVQVDIRGRFDDYFIALLTAAAAIGAGYIAVLGIRAQIAHADQLERRRRDGSFKAASAMLPLALSELSEASLNNIRRHFNVDDLFPGTLPVDEFAVFPREALEIVRSCIEFADEKSRQELAYLIRGYQILAARADTVARGRRITTDTQGNMIEMGRIGDAVNWAEMHATISNAFEYARGQRDTIRPFEYRMTWSAFLQAGLSHGDFPHLEVLLERREQEKRWRLRIVPN